MKNLTPTQRQIAAAMLDLAANDFSGHICNDMSLHNTPANREFVRGMIAASDYPGDDLHISKDGALIYVMDWQVMRYCADLLRKEIEAAE